jgi:RNA polymerase sigma-70 factor (ECF subfamily)
MEPENADERLSHIPTQWSVIVRAHQGTPEAVPATGQLLERYRRPIYRYLLACVRGLDAAEELFQEFALRFVRGDFKNADPGRGRFRYYLKTVLRHLVVDHRRKQERDSHEPLPTSDVGPETDSGAAEPEAELMEEWRKELLRRVWEALLQWESRTRQPYYTVLQLRAEHPDLRTAQIAARLTVQLGQAVTAEWVYKKLHFAREKFSDLLLEEVARTLAQPTVENLEQELLDLGLLEHCRAALERFGNG